MLFVFINVVILVLFRLDRKIACAPSDLMNFIEACAMGNFDRVTSLIHNGVVRVSSMATLQVNLVGMKGQSGTRQIYFSFPFFPFPLLYKR